MTIYDHLLVFTFAVAYPLYGFISYRRFMANLSEDEVIDRKSMYLQTIVPHWILFLIAVFAWWWSGRDWSDIGVTISADPIQLWMLVGIVAVIATYLIFIWRLQTGRSDRQEWLERMNNVELVLPRRRDELSHFYALSITAGVVEELLWRGLLIWYLQFAVPLWAAVLISSILFGLAHAYQGLKSMPPIVFIGLVFSLIYVFSGSLLLAVLLHAVFDALQGRLAYEVLAEPEVSPSP